MNSGLRDYYLVPWEHHEAFPLEESSHVCVLSVIWSVNLQYQILILIDTLTITISDKWMVDSLSENQKTPRLIIYQCTQPDNFLIQNKNE